MRTLQAFGFEWDGEVVRQRERSECYADALASLNARQLTFECSCSRLQLEDDSRYPGTCRVRPPPAGVATATRLRVEPATILYGDRIQGSYRQDVAGAVGDVILKRRDQVVSYLLAVVADDADQGVTHVVRGADLLDNTPRQIYLQRALGLPQPAYAHVPVLTEPDGTKLAKSRRTVRVQAGRAVPQLQTLFSMLGLKPPRSLLAASVADAWSWAVENWRIERVPRRLHMGVRDWKTYK